MKFNVESTSPTIWKLVPAGTRDEYAAGYDGNHFASEEDAITAIEGLRACGPEFDHEWIAIEVES